MFKILLKLLLGVIIAIIVVPFCLLKKIYNNKICEWVIKLGINLVSKLRKWR